MPNFLVTPIESPQTRPCAYDQTQGSCVDPCDPGRSGEQMSGGDASGADLQVRPTGMLSCPLASPGEAYVLFAN